MTILAKTQLAKPSINEQKIADNLKEQISEKIKKSAGKSISFSEYFNLALYSPWGYYQNSQINIGKKGDFITAVELGNLLAHSLFELIIKSFKQLNKAIIYEFGAGSGQLIVDLCYLFAQQNKNLEHYYVIEISQSLRKKQQKLIEQKAPEFLNKITWLESLPKNENLIGVIIANELLDALAFDCFVQKKAGSKPNFLNEKSIYEKKVALTKDGNFCWQLEKANDWQLETIQTINQNLDAQFHYFSQDYQSEFAPDYDSFFANIKASFAQAISIWLDYGLNDRQYYSPIRPTGTLRCYYRHCLHQDPFYLPGICDITAHTHFSALLRCANKNKLEMIHYTTQGQFLLHSHWQQIFAQTKNTKQKIALSNQIKQLILPNQMGEIFKLMILAWAVDKQKIYQSLQLKSRDLSYQL